MNNSCLFRAGAYKGNFEVEQIVVSLIWEIF